MGTQAKEPAVRAPRSRSRGRILAAALKAFSQRGFHETRMDDIAALAGVAKGTLYYNFPSKTDLFAALVDEGMARFIETLGRESVSDLPFPQHFRRLVGVHVDLLLAWRDLFRIAANPVTHGFDPGTVERIEAARDRYVGFVAGAIRQGQALGYLRPCDPEMAAAQVLGLMDGMLRHHRRTRKELTAEALAESLHALLSEGLVQPRVARGAAPRGKRDGGRRGGRGEARRTVEPPR